MTDDSLQQLLDALVERGVLPDSKANPAGVMAVLVSATVEFRDALKEDTGETLTVGDTRRALSGLEALLKGRALPDDLTDIQRRLVSVWYAKLTVLKGQEPGEG
jgi:hypothetical protein